MPSKTQRQANLMSAIKHGWEPPASMKHAPSLKVATEFHEADKREGKFEHATGYADGGTVDTNKTQDGLNLIAHAADRATSWLHDPHQILSRVAAGLASQVVGMDDKGRPQLGKTPGIVKETEAIPAGLADIGNAVMPPLGHLADRVSSSTAGRPLSALPIVGDGIRGVQAARDLLASLKDRYGDDAPAWSRSADASADATHKATREAMGLAAPRGFTENTAEALGTMLGQIPIGAEKSGESLLAKLARSPAEWLGPTVRPSLANYGVGTLAGGLSGLGGDATEVKP